MTTRRITGFVPVVSGLGLAAALLAAGCSSEDFNILNTNDPTVEQLTQTPTRATLARAALGSAAALYNDVGFATDLYSIFGREGWDLQGLNPLFTTEMLAGPLTPGGFGGLLWTSQYVALRAVNTYLSAIDKASDLSSAEKAASLGYAQTLKALLFHRLIVRTGALGIPLAVDVPVDAPPAPFVSQQNVYAALVALLDEARTNLAAGGAAFPFNMPPGYTGFGTPATFVRFNRALYAKIQIHRATLAACGLSCYQQALTALNDSFISTTGLPGSLSTGVYLGYSTAAGEPANPLSEPLSAQRLWVHPSLQTGVELKLSGQPDDRFATKVRPAGPRTVNSLTGTLKPVIYNVPGTFEADLGADIPLLKNEELILLRAEARWFTGDKTGAIADIDLIRTSSGGLPPSSLTAASSDAAFITQLLYNRLYSLLWEQGTRWVDARRFGRLNTLPIDRPGDQTFPNFLVPAPECDARGLTAPCQPPTS